MANCLIYKIICMLLLWHVKCTPFGLNKNLRFTRGHGHTGVFQISSAAGIHAGMRFFFN